MKEFTKDDVGKTVFHAQIGRTEIMNFRNRERYPVLLGPEPLKTTTKDGKSVRRDIHPVLFHSYEEFMEYWKENNPKKKINYECWALVIFNGKITYTNFFASEEAANNRKNELTAWGYQILEIIHIEREYEI